MARALTELPLIREAFSVGEISYSKVRALTRVATGDNEQVLLQIARYGTAAHMERLVGHYRRVQRQEAAGQAMRQHDAQRLDCYTDDDGMLVIKGRFTPEQGALLLKALEVAGEQVEPVDPPVSAEIPVLTAGQRRAQALVDLAGHFLASEARQRGGGDRYLVMVHVDAETLKDPDRGGVPYLESDIEISAETSRRLACDASVIRVIDDEDGEPLSIGRKRRSIPPALRRALQLRDKGCRFPGCTHTRFIDGHHVQHWANGGETSLTNLVSLCRFHHRLIHEGSYTIRISHDGAFAFYDPDDKLLPRSPPMKPPRGELIADAALRERITQRRRTYWDGNGMDYGQAIDILLASESED